jgi:tRNA(fMet)-specific endonuclease VapC
MVRYLLDTDHFTLHERGLPSLRQRLVSHPPDACAISIVTAEEALRGRLGILRKRHDGAARMRAYAKLLETIQFLNTIMMIPFDQPCEDGFQGLRSQKKLRVGSQDLKIAATALAHKLIVVTRNRQDFERVPGLIIEDWSGG